MQRPRIIPVLLLKDLALVKSIGFKDYRYIGDPINAVHIFNDLRADELVFLDIEATKQGRSIDADLVRKIGEEANMPFSVGGGIRTLEQIRALLACGAERVILTSVAQEDPEFVRRAVSEFGSSTISVCIDVKKKWLGGLKVYSHREKTITGVSPIAFAKNMEELGAGEVIVQSVDLDGTMEGYDIELIKGIAHEVTIPVVALGGAGSIHDLKKAYDEGFASGVASGSLFVYQSKRRGVLINYPEEGI